MLHRPFPTAKSEFTLSPQQPQIEVPFCPFKNSETLRSVLKCTFLEVRALKSGRYVIRYVKRAMARLSSAFFPTLARNTPAQGVVVCMALIKSIRQSMYPTASPTNCRHTTTRCASPSVLSQPIATAFQFVAKVGNQKKCREDNFHWIVVNCQLL